jgi:hypothetical protein
MVVEIPMRPSWAHPHVFGRMQEIYRGMPALSAESRRRPRVEPRYMVRLDPLAMSLSHNRTADMASGAQ